jgi:hypothetical protein
MGGRVLSEEELQTVATQIEGMMNDRPLYQPSADPDDLPITPSMLMHGRQLGQLPMAEGEEVQGQAEEKIDRLWKRRRALFDDAWKDILRRLRSRNFAEVLEMDGGNKG